MNTEVVPPAAITRAEDVVGRITITSISVGEPILPTKLGGANGQIFVVIPPEALGANGSPAPNSPNYRAMSISVPDPQAAGGFIQPGDIVDVLFTMTISPDRFFKKPDPAVNAIDASARIVLERVPILSRTASVYVIRTDAATAERIAYLQSAGGALQLILRGPKDDRATGTVGASFDNIQPDWKWHIPVKITP
jgi:Flp pilus assembly protein CpaB